MGAHKPPLEAWIADEVFVQYQVPRPLTNMWLKNDQVVLLLDGLDEVAETQRDTCVEAINYFRGRFASEMVVCSRVADYEKLSQRLNLSIALRIQPLTLQQMRDYLKRFGPVINGFRKAIKDNENLQKLAETPLMLSMVPIAYANLQSLEIPRATSLEATRRNLLESYVRQMFRRRPMSQTVSYTKFQAIRWLCNLAKGMKNHNQSIFFIE